MEAFHCLNELGKKLGWCTSNWGREGRESHDGRRRCCVCSRGGIIFSGHVDVDPCSMDGNLSGGIVILLIEEDSTRGCWVPAEECLHTCLLGSILISHEEKPTKGPDAAVILQKFVVAEQQGSRQRVEVVVDVINR